MFSINQRNSETINRKLHILKNFYKSFDLQNTAKTDYNIC